MPNLKPSDLERELEIRALEFAGSRVVVVVVQFSSTDGAEERTRVQDTCRISRWRMSVCLPRVVIC